MREKDSMEMSPETSKRSYVRFRRLNSIASKILIKVFLSVFNNSDNCRKHKKRIESIVSIDIRAYNA